jgi:spermidine synthase
MCGLIPSILRPGLQKGMIIGLGTGSTAGWMAAIPEMKQVDVVELEPATVEVARRCAPANLNVLENPKVRIHMADAREVLLTTPERYDIIFSEPSNPYRAGIASLFTKEFYESVSERLTPDGVFAQWVQAYEIDGRAVRTAYATLGSVFPHIQTWQTLGGDFLLIGSRAPVALNVEQIKSRIATEPFRSALLEAWGVNTVEGFFAHFVAGNRLARAIVEAGNATVTTDDRNSLEFGFARNVGHRAPEPMNVQLRQTAAALGCALPELEGQIDLDEVQNEAAIVELGIGAARVVSPESPAIARRPLLFAYLQGNFERVRQLWRAKPFEPRSIFELRALSESLARTGDPEAWRFLAQLAAWRPSDADALIAAAFAHDKAWADSAQYLNKAFLAWRKDPWPPRNLVVRTLDLADKVAEAAGQVSIARDLFAALQEPFSVEFARERRINSLLTIARFTELQPANERVRQILDQYGDMLPWQKSFLEMRVGVYKELKDPRMLDAAEDLLRYREGETERFDRGINLSPPALAGQP